MTQRHLEERLYRKTILERCVVSILLSFFMKRRDCIRGDGESVVMNVSITLSLLGHLLIGLLFALESAELCLVAVWSVC